MKNTKFAIVLCIVIYLLIALFATGCTVHPSSTAVTAPPVSPSPVPSAVPETKAKLVIDPNIGSTPTPAPTLPPISIPGWVAMHLPSGRLDAEVSLYNPEDNADWYYLTFELALVDTDEVIFSTGLIPPGSYCTKVNLTRELQRGEYDAVMHVCPYRMNEELTATNNADALLTLIVD